MNLSEFQSVINDSPPTRERHYGALHTRFDMWLTPKLSKIMEKIYETNSSFHVK